MTKSEAGLLGAAKTKEWHRAQVESRISEYLKAPKTCACCGVLIPYESRLNKFCSHSCSSRFNGKAMSPKFSCKECGGPSKFIQFCSNKCYRINFTNGVRSRMESGDVKNPQAIRKYLLIDRGERCECCGLSDWMNTPIPLEIHHVDGNSDNNLPINLKVLCRNCHAIHPHFRRGNIGSGRHFRRRSRYALGLSR